MRARALARTADGGGAEFGRWMLAAAAALAAHSALMAAYLLAPPPRPEGAAMAPAVIVDLAPLPVAPQSQADLAPGPEMIELPTVPEPPQRAEHQEIEPLPKVETPAVVTLPLREPAAREETPKLVEKPRPVPPEPKQVERTAPAPKTTAPQRSESRPAPVARAPSPGSTASRAAIASWRDRVVARLQSAKRYPSGASGQGTAAVSFTVDRGGRVVGRRLMRSSGHSALDSEALAMVDRAQPFPPFPPAMTQARIALTVPVRFAVR